MLDSPLQGSLCQRCLVPMSVAPWVPFALALRLSSSLASSLPSLLPFHAAVTDAVNRAKKAGSVAPFLVFQGCLPGPGFEKTLLVSLVAALGATYAPLSHREFKGEAATEPVANIYFHAAGVSAEEATAAAAHAHAIELGKRVARDVGGADPERGAPPKLVAYLKAAFAGVEGVSMTVVEDEATITKEYPCAAAVARASFNVPRHAPAIVRLEYNGPGPITRQTYFVGKGITYDTGGVDVKTGGAMVNMSRDKCGAATVAGVIRTAAALRTPGLRIVGYLALIRNNIGEEAYTSDEIIVSRAGKRVLVVNTDAEGRMAMVDLLAAAKEEVLAQPKEARVPTTLHTVATLTGHAVIAVGMGFSIAVDNGPARRAGFGAALKATGEAMADPFELSTPRSEDFAFVAPKTIEYDLYQCNTAPSSQTPRGHIFPAAFLTIGSGLDAHGLDSTDPLQYSHLDIAASSVAAPYANGVTTGQPVAALAALLCNM